MSDALTKPDVNTVEDLDVTLNPYDEDAPGDGQTHIVNPSDNLHIWVPGMSVQAMVNFARFHGLPLKALCGYTWVAKRNPENYPACDSCVRIAGQLMRENGE